MKNFFFVFFPKKIKERLSFQVLSLKKYIIKLKNELSLVFTFKNCCRIKVLKVYFPPSVIFEDDKAGFQWLQILKNLQSLVYSITEGIYSSYFGVNINNCGLYDPVKQFDSVNEDK